MSPRAIPEPPWDLRTSGTGVCRFHLRYRSDGVRPCRVHLVDDAPALDDLGADGFGRDLDGWTKAESQVSSIALQSLGGRAMRPPTRSGRYTRDDRWIAGTATTATTLTSVSFVVCRPPLHGVRRYLADHSAPMRPTFWTTSASALSIRMNTMSPHTVGARRLASLPHGYRDRQQPGRSDEHPAHPGVCRAYMWAIDGAQTTLAVLC